MALQENSLDPSYPFRTVSTPKLPIEKHRLYRDIADIGRGLSPQFQDGHNNPLPGITEQIADTLDIPQRVVANLITAMRAEFSLTAAGRHLFNPSLEAFSMEIHRFKQTYALIKNRERPKTASVIIEEWKQGTVAQFYEFVFARTNAHARQLLLPHELAAFFIFYQISLANNNPSSELDFALMEHAATHALSSTDFLDKLTKDSGVPIDKDILAQHRHALAGQIHYKSPRQRQR